MNEGNKNNILNLTFDDVYCERIEIAIETIKEQRKAQEQYEKYSSEVAAIVEFINTYCIGDTEEIQVGEYYTVCLERKRDYGSIWLRYKEDCILDSVTIREKEFYKSGNVDIIFSLLLLINERYLEIPLHSKPHNLFKIAKDRYIRQGLYGDKND